MYTQEYGWYGKEVSVCGTMTDTREIYRPIGNLAVSLCDNCVIQKIQKEKKILRFLAFISVLVLMIFGSHALIVKEIGSVVALVILTAIFTLLFVIWYEFYDRLPSVQDDNWDEAAKALSWKLKSDAIMKQFEHADAFNVFHPGADPLSSSRREMLYEDNRIKKFILDGTRHTFRYEIGVRGEAVEHWD